MFRIIFEFQTIFQTLFGIILQILKYKLTKLNYNHIPTVAMAHQLLQQEE